jgi:hypothetical protein
LQADGKSRVLGDEEGSMCRGGILCGGEGSTLYSMCRGGFYVERRVLNGDMGYMWRGGFNLERIVRRDEEGLCGEEVSMWRGEFDVTRRFYVETWVLCG